MATARDLDLDGDLDVVATDGSGDKIHAYQDTGSHTWSRVEIASADGPYAIHGLDLDTDGDTDFIGSATDDELATIVCLHDTASSGRQWRPLRKLLEGDFRGDARQRLLA